MLATGKKLFADGTFQAVPTIFNQMVTFHTMFKAEPWPCLHALYSSKSQTTYMLMYHNMKLSFAYHSLVASSRSINADFELAIKQAIRIHYQALIFMAAILKKFLNEEERKFYKIEQVRKTLACPYLLFSSTKTILQNIFYSICIKRLRPAQMTEYLPVDPLHNQPMV